ncbi:MAG TPA: M28 family peptidase [Planctomycetota bacterium]|nr:M28 family peptidase [Planctomycetota bacterium]
MPGKSWGGPLPPLTAEEKALSESLRRDVTALAQSIGIRNWLTHSALEAAADYLERRFREAGHAVSRQTFLVEGQPFHNLEVEIRGASHPDEVVVVGGHYDSVVACPGANDNATGAAATVALAAAFAKEKPARTLRFVAFTNEEPPHYRTDQMGSVVYAKRCRERHEKVVAMMSLETMGFYSDREASQGYPVPLSMFYPSQGNFIAFVSNVSSRRLLKQAIRVFREEVKFPSEGAALPSMLPGIGWSDHWSFWEQGYPAIMVTDTAPFRYKHYHTAQDTVDKVDFDSLARVTRGLVPVVRALATPAP